MSQSEKTMISMIWYSGKGKTIDIVERWVVARG